MHYEKTLINLTTEQFIHLVDLCAFGRISQAQTNRSKIRLTASYLSGPKQILWELHVSHYGSSESSIFEGWFYLEAGFQACVTITTFKKKKIVHTQGGWVPVDAISQYLKDEGYCDKGNEPAAINPQLSSELETTLLDLDYSPKPVFENERHVINKTNYTDELLAMVFLLLGVIHFVVKLYKALTQPATIRKFRYFQLGIACSCRHHNINDAALRRQ